MVLGFALFVVALIVGLAAYKKIRDEGWSAAWKEITGVLGLAAAGAVDLFGQFFGG